MKKQPQIALAELDVWSHAYCDEFIHEIAAEINDWRDTSILKNGYLRALANQWAPYVQSNTLAIAESYATTAAWTYLLRTNKTRTVQLP